jgi:hypothetical protein
MTPILPDAASRFIESNIACAHRPRKTRLHAILFARFVPWLQFKIARIIGGTAETKRDAMIEFKIDEQFLGDFQFANQANFDAVRVA